MGKLVGEIMNKALEKYRQKVHQKKLIQVTHSYFNCTNASEPDLTNTLFHKVVSRKQAALLQSCRESRDQKRGNKPGLNKNTVELYIKTHKYKYFIICKSHYFKKCCIQAQPLADVCDLLGNLLSYYIDVYVNAL